MANEFSIAQDIKIEFNLPFGGRGIWNSSTWGGADNWQANPGDSFTWTDIVATVTRAEINLGATVQDGFYAPVTPNTFNVTLQSPLYDPFNNTYLKPGLGVRFSYRPNPDTAPSTYTTLFQGFVDTFDVSYDADGNVLLNLACSSSLKRFLGVNVSTWNTTGANDLFTMFNNWITATGATVGSTWNAQGGDYLYLSETLTDEAAADILDYMNQVENGLIWQDPTNNYVMGYSSRYFQTLLNTTPTNSFSNTHSTASTHFCITDIGFTFDQEAVYNSYVISSAATPTTFITKKNQDLIDLYGEMRLEKTLRLTSGGLQSWLDNQATKNPARRVSMVQTSAIEREGQLANLDALLPAKAVNVNVNRSTYTVNEDAFITRATHQIDPDNWYVTLELWKGL